MAIDWTIPLSDQTSLSANNPAEADVILGAECIWLRELLEPFVEVHSAAWTGALKLISATSAP
jgi:hypothetical protein